MICVILVAGHAVVLEREIQEDASGKYAALTGVPKALLPARPGSEFAAIEGGDRILDCWWKTLKSRQQFSEIYLVTNADKYKHYERWATASGFPLDNIINDGSTTYKNSLGAVADLDLVIRCKSIADDVMVVAGDMLFDDNFDIGQVLDYFKLKKGNLAIYYKLEEGESTETRGIVEVDQMTGRITRFLEKPRLSETDSRLASPVFYCLQRSSLKLVSQYTEEHLDCAERVFGLFMSWLVRNSTVYGMKLPTRFQLIGQIHLADYEKWISVFSQKKHSTHKSESFTSRTYARVGLMGNPSDGYHGKTISFSITNFWADVTIVESSKLKLTLHPLNDPTEFGSLSDLYGISRKEGYLGGLRLLQATCKKFYEYCAKNGIALAKRNFTLKYDTNIPRQVGLAGSSAIITSTLKCLMHFYHVTETDIPKPMQPQFVLDVETSELFITAGLQDRVIQVYQGLVYMDFGKELMETQGHGNYECMDANKLPQFWLAYLADPSDSGKMHSNVKQRWLRDEPEVVAAMKTFANLTDQAKAAIEMENYEELVSLMNQNFDLRRKIYTDRALGDANIQMIDIARKHGSAAKFTGSGGAIVGLCLDQTKKLQMMQEFRSSGFVCCDLEPYCPQQPPSS